jgi:hypothetical protein
MGFLLLYELSMQVMDKLKCNPQRVQVDTKAMKALRILLARF